MKLQNGGPCREGHKAIISRIGVQMLVCLTVACSPNRYEGIDLRAGRVEKKLQQLVVRASAGDKSAQIQLGYKFEEGNGVPKCLNRAERLYSQAAADSGGTIWAYVPPVVKGQIGRIEKIDETSIMPGLEVAKQELQRLRLKYPALHTSHTSPSCGR